MFLFHCLSIFPSPPFLSLIHEPPSLTLIFSFHPILSTIPSSGNPVCLSFPCILTKATQEYTRLSIPVSLYHFPYFFHSPASLSPQQPLPLPSPHLSFPIRNSISTYLPSHHSLSLSLYPFPPIFHSLASSSHYLPLSPITSPVLSYR